MNGVIYINKPAGWTSRDVVNKISSIYKTKKVGHTGTLDPMATGVLVVCVGSYTKLVSLLTSLEKEYLVKMRIGLKTNTGDITGEILEETNKPFKKEDIISSFRVFPKEYEQKVPIYSAVKVNGKKLYEYAREGKDVVCPSKKVLIKKLELLSILSDEVTFLTTVSKGTYIRSLIEDIANTFHNVATMTMLTRLKSGSISLKDCLNIEDINCHTPLKKLEDIFDYPCFEITDDLITKVKNGNLLKLESLEERLFLTINHEVVALYEKSDSFYHLLFKVI